MDIDTIEGREKFGKGSQKSKFKSKKGRLNRQILLNIADLFPSRKANQAVFVFSGFSLFRVFYFYF
jgi:hypothetical protein